MPPASDEKQPPAMMPSTDDALLGAQLAVLHFTKLSCESMPAVPNSLGCFMFET
jgi:hypothetical protein